MKSLVLVPPARSPGRRGMTLAAWAVPGALLAVLPKCPACLAAYIALWTGIGLTVPVVSALRWALTLVCAASLIFLVYRAARRRCCTQPPECLRKNFPIAGTTGITDSAGKSTACHHA